MADTVFHLQPTGAEEAPVERAGQVLLSGGGEWQWPHNHLQMQSGGRAETKPQNTAPALPIGLPRAQQPLASHLEERVSERVLVDSSSAYPECTGLNTKRS